MRVAVDHREVILQTAAKLFARKPFHEVLMEDVAENAGIAKGTIYRFFPNKDDLFVALSMRYLEMLSTELGEVAAGGGAPLQRLRAMLVRLVEIIDERRDFFQVMQRQECNLWAHQKGSEFIVRRTAIRTHFVGVLDEARAARVLRCPFETTIAADMLLGMVRNMLRFTLPQPAPEKIAEMTLHVFIKGLGYRRNGGPA